MKVQLQMSRLHEQQKKIDSDLEAAETRLSQINIEIREIDRTVGALRLRHGDLSSVEANLRNEEQLQQREMAIVSQLRVQREQAGAVANVAQSKKKLDALQATKQAQEEKRKRDEAAGKKLQKIAQEKINRTVAQQRQMDEAKKQEEQAAHEKKVRITSTGQLDLIITPGLISAAAKARN
jgi:hypothetical protein